MKYIQENLNPGVFLAGLGLLTYGIWDVSPSVACMVVGGTLMALVVADASVRIALKMRQRK